MQDNNKLKVVRSALNCIRLFLLCWVMLQKLNSAKLSSTKEQCRKQTLYVIGLLVKKSSVDSKQLVKNNLLFLDKGTSSCYRRSRLQCTVTSKYPRTKTSYGDRSFSVHGPSVWNSLPNDLRLSDMSLETFTSRLEAFLFGH